jgi:hypothetical protein
MRIKAKKDAVSLTRPGDDATPWIMLPSQVDTGA